MMLTTKGRYAVMAMVDIAGHESQKPISLADIALRQGITTAYLEQIFSQLKKNNLVKSVRGPGGGYLLANTAEDIKISDIIEAVEESIKMTRCNHDPSAGCMSDRAKCLTHDLWDGLSNHIHAYLNSVSLSDICARKVRTEPIFAEEDAIAINNNVN